jgi:hypothetical protein
VTNAFFASSLWSDERDFCEAEQAWSQGKGGDRHERQAENCRMSGSFRL